LEFVLVIIVSVGVSQRSTKNVAGGLRDVLVGVICAQNALITDVAVATSEVLEHDDAANEAMSIMA
jgi:hypothetical protein